MLLRRPAHREDGIHRLGLLADVEDQDLRIAEVGAELGAVELIDGRVGDDEGPANAEGVGKQGIRRR